MGLRRLVLVLGMLLLIGLPGTARAAGDGEEVDLALVLAVDISYSMDPEELKLQRQGYIDAFNSSEVQRAIAMGMLGRIAITYIEWANANDQRIVLPWTILDGAETIRSATDTIAAAPTRRAQRTSISGALLFSHKQLQTMPYRALRKVIDVSGDGPNNAGIGVEAARAQVLADGITINGLPVMLKRDHRGWGDIDNLDHYYQDCVVGGPGAFVISIRAREEFQTATRQKIIREVAELGVPDVRPQLAQAGRSDCMIGERRVRDRWDN